MGKMTFTEKDFEKAAITFDRDLLKIPVLALKDTTKYMTMRTGIRGTQLVGSETVKAQFAPYKANRKTDADLELILRPLTTYFGSLNADFDPNEAISTLMGHRASQAMADGLATTLTAKEVLALIGKEAAEQFVYEIWSAERDANGTTTHDLFDGFDTISAADIASGELSAEKGNLLVLEEAITEENAVAAYFCLQEDSQENVEETPRSGGVHLLFAGYRRRLQRELSCHSQRYSLQRQI